MNSVYHVDFDTALFHAINTFHGEWYDRFMVLATAISSRLNFPIYIALILFFAWWTLGRNKNAAPDQRQAIKRLWYRLTFVFTLAFVSDTIFVEIAKQYFHRPRPFVTLPLESMRLMGPVLGKAEYYVSFPSGHASFAAVIVASFWPLLHPTGKLLGLLFILWVCWSRIALGVHYPADVAVGTLSGLLITFGIRTIIEKRRLFEKMYLSERL